MATARIANNNIAATAAAWDLEAIGGGQERRPITCVERPRDTRPARALNYGLWSVQALLALVFLFAGSTKLLLPIEVLTSMGSPNQIALPGWFLRFIGVAEVLGAIGLVLPTLLRIRPHLTALAATGLVIIMIGATSLTLASGEIMAAIVPAVVGLLATFVARGRWNIQNIE
jgi:uncharacterized membrane protein YphA (DoxX/SURF4 family)